MRSGRQGILVIDDDEVVLVAIADVLEESGFEVFTQTSPIGATQVIARESIDAAVIDVNLPVMQGDKVVRLLQSWDRVQDLAVVIMSGAPQATLAHIQKQLPDVSVVPKSRMDEDLVPAVRAALASRVARGASRSASPKEGRVSDLVARFTESLAETMASSVDWRALAKGPEATRDGLHSRFATLQGQAQLLGLEQAGQLIASLADALRSLRADRPPSQHAQNNIESAMAALSGLKRSSTGEFLLTPEPLIRGLEHVVKEMRAP